MVHWSAATVAIRRRLFGRPRESTAVVAVGATVPARGPRRAVRRRRQRAPDCHRGRLIDDAIAREMARALGVVTCPECHRSIAVKGRNGTVLRPAGAGWRETP